jgi:hypothetical protein
MIASRLRGSSGTAILTAAEADMDTDLGTPIWSRSIPFLLFYFAPVLIGAYRRFKDPESSWPVWALFLVVFLTGWSVIGWLFALRKAFKDKALPDWLTTPAGYQGGGGSLAVPDAPAQPNEQSCAACGSFGTSGCSVCGTRGTWYENGTQQYCYTCGGTGKMKCLVCGGSGRTRIW